MSGRRKNLKPNVLVDSYLKRSNELDERLDDLSKDIEAHNTQVRKRDALTERISELSDYIDDAKVQVESLKPLFVEASFNQDHAALTEIDGRRARLLEEINQYTCEQEQVRKQLAGVVIDGTAIAELSAELDAGIRPPDFKEFLRVLEADCKQRATAQAKKITELRSAVPAQFKDQQTYDAARKQLDSSYRTSEESKRAAERIQTKREEERRRFLEHTPRSSEEVRREKDRQLTLANSTPVREFQQW